MLYERGRRFLTEDHRGTCATRTSIGSTGGEAQGLYAFLAYRTGDRALAEDLLADTFERALRARRGFDRRRGTERNWLYAIALNLLRDHARRAATEGRAVDRVRSGAPVSTDSGAEEVERRDELRAP